MTYSNELESKIQTYLRSLSPKAVEALVSNLQQAKVRKNADPHLNLVLAAAAALIPKVKPADLGGPDRKAQVQRLFFAPLDSFLISETLPVRQEGRINRAMIERVWKWLGRDVIPNEVKTVLDQAGSNAVSGERVDALVQALRSRAVEAVGEALHRSEISEKDRRLIAVELGGDRGIAELKDIYKIFAAERWLVPFLQNIPDRINEHRLKHDFDVLRMVDKCSSRFPDHLPLIASALVDRSEVPAALCTFAGRLAGDLDPKVIAGSPFAPIVDVVMSEAERLQILALDHRNNNPDPVAFSRALSDYHSLVRGVERDMDLSMAGRWQQRLSETKRNISSEVTRELKSAHGAIRRALQVPRLDKDGQFEQDQAAIDEAVRILRVLMMARGASETLAVSEVEKQTRQSIEQTLELLTRTLMTDLGKARGRDVLAQLSAVDVAVMLSEIYFGADYAAQLRRSRQAAVTKAAGHGPDGSPPPVSGPERRLVKSALGQG